MDEEYGMLCAHNLYLLASTCQTKSIVIKNSNRDSYPLEMINKNKDCYVYIFNRIDIKINKPEFYLFHMHYNSDIYYIKIKNAKIQVQSPVKKIEHVNKEINGKNISLFSKMFNFIRNFGKK